MVSTIEGLHCSNSAVKQVSRLRVCTAGHILNSPCTICHGGGKYSMQHSFMESVMEITHMHRQYNEAKYCDMNTCH